MALISPQTLHISQPTQDVVEISNDHKQNQDTEADIILPGS